MLKLRLSMGGTKKRPVYKIVVADSRFPRDGRFIEKLGYFNPLLPKDKKDISFLSFGNSGLKYPSFSINLPSLGNLLSATTILYTGLFFVPPIDNLSFNIFSPLLF